MPTRECQRIFAAAVFADSRRHIGAFFRTAYCATAIKIGVTLPRRWRRLHCHPSTSGDSRWMDLCTTVRIFSKPRWVMSSVARSSGSRA